jgi:hypothetical protein
MHDDGSKPEANNSKPKSLMRRYDRRAFNGRYQSTNKRGPKPLYLKTKSLNSSLRSLASFEKIATDEDIYKKAWDVGDYKTCAELKERNRNRAFGRPFVAVNPAAQPAGPVQDNRLQDAIKKLVLPNTQPKTVSEPQPKTEIKPDVVM